MCIVACIGESCVLWKCIGVDVSVCVLLLCPCILDGVEHALEWLVRWGVDEVMSMSEGIGAAAAHCEIAELFVVVLLVLSVVVVASVSVPEVFEGVHTKSL